MEIYLYKILLVIFYVVLAGVAVLTTVGLPGNWMLVGIAFIVGLITRFTGMTWGYLLLCVGLATIGEIVEAVLGAVVVARRGGSRWGVIGSIVGGFAGVIWGAPVAPPIGSLVFGFVGAFLGAVLGEVYKQREMGPALKIGFWSFVGKVLAITVKLGAGCVIFWIIVTTTWV